MPRVTSRAVAVTLKDPSTKRLEKRMSMERDKQTAETVPRCCMAVPDVAAEKACPKAKSACYAAGARGLLGVIDVGSNTVRLCVYRVCAAEERLAPGKNACSQEAGSESLPFTKIFDTKAAVGLASHMKDGVLDEAGIQAACTALSQQREYAALLGCEDVRVFATAAVRNCANSASVVQAMQERSGLAVAVLSGIEEARLGLKGALWGRSLDEAAGCVLADVGGGSVELARYQTVPPLSSEEPAVFACSVALGSLLAWEGFASGLLPTQAEADAMRQALRALLQDQPSEQLRASTILGIGGSVRMVAKVCAVLQEGKGAPSLEVLTPDMLDGLMMLNVADPQRLARIAARVDASRIHTFVPGCALIQEIFAATGATTLRVSGASVREGFVLEELGL